MLMFSPLALTWELVVESMVLTYYMILGHPPSILVTLLIGPRTLADALPRAT